MVRREGIAVDSGDPKLEAAAAFCSPSFAVCTHESSMINVTTSLIIVVSIH
jgi:hypothetical protein